MTNPETKSQYEGAILNQLVQTVEKVTRVEATVNQNSQKIDNLDLKLDSLDPRLDSLDQRLINVESLLGWLRIIGGGVVAIALSLIANFVYSFLY